MLNNDEKYVSLVTRRRDGSSVATPVWFAAVGNEFGVITETNVGKVKRIRNNPRVTVQVCDVRGGVAPQAPVLAATARLVTGTDAVRVRKAVARKYGLTYAGWWHACAARRTRLRRPQFCSRSTVESETLRRGSMNA
jgi:PPOX class probable F420-dependent enzyme